MPHRCSLYRIDRQQDALGSSRDIPSLMDTDVECWEQQASASEIHEWMQRGVKCSRKIFFPEDPGITEQYEIVITSRDRGDTELTEDQQLRLTVVAQPQPDAGAGLGVVYRIMCDEWTATR